MTKILFLPSDHGGGMGHVSRCLYLCRLARLAGHECAIALEEKHYHQYKNTGGLKIFLFPTRPELLTRLQFKSPFLPRVRLAKLPPAKPVFVEFCSLAWQVPRDGYLSPRIIRRRMRLLSGIVENFKPDVCIGDTHFLARILARKFDIPIVQITRKAGYPPDPGFIWWKNNPPDWKAPDALAPFEEILQEYPVESVNRAEDLLLGDRYLIPAIPEIEPVNDSEKNTIYCGPLIDLPKKEQFSDDEKKIYVTVGGGASRSRLNEFFKTIIDAFHRTPFQVLVSTAGYVSAKKFENRFNNIRFEDWVDGKKAVAEHHLIIYHGGYGSTMEILSAGKKAIVIPSHTEQEGNGRRLEALGIGKVLPLSNRVDSALEFRWPYGNYQMGAAFSYDLTTEKLNRIIDELLKNNAKGKQQKIALTLRKAQREFTLDQLISF